MQRRGSQTFPGTDRVYLSAHDRGQVRGPNPSAARVQPQHSAEGFDAGGTSERTHVPPTPRRDARAPRADDAARPRTAPVRRHRMVPARIRPLRGRPQLRRRAVGGDRQRARDRLANGARGEPADRGQPALLPPRALGDLRPRRRLGRVGPPVDGRGGPPRDRAARLPDRHARPRSGGARARAHGPGLARLLPDGNGGSRALDPLDGVVYTTLQELATRIAHRNTGTFTQDRSSRSSPLGSRPTRTCTTCSTASSARRRSRSRPPR